MRRVSWVGVKDDWSVLRSERLVGSEVMGGGVRGIAAGEIFR